MMPVPAQKVDVRAPWWLVCVPLYIMNIWEAGSSTHFSPRFWLCRSAPWVGWGRRLVCGSLKSWNRSIVVPGRDQGRDRDLHSHDLHVRACGLLRLGEGLEETPQHPGLLGLLKDRIRPARVVRPCGGIGEIDRPARCMSFGPCPFILAGSPTGPSGQCCACQPAQPRPRARLRATWGRRRSSAAETPHGIRRRVAFPQSVAPV